MQFLEKLRPDSHTFIREVVSVKLFITRIKGHSLLGCPNQSLPQKLANCRALYKFEKDSNNHPYNDRKCALRCAAFHLLRMDRKTKQNGNRRLAGLSRKVEDLRLAYCQVARVDVFKPFPGVSVADMHHLENVAKININVFTYSNGSEPVEAHRTAMAEMTVDEQLLDMAAVEGEEDEFIPDDMDDILNEWESRPEGLAGQRFLDNNLMEEDQVVEQPVEAEPFFQIVSH